MKGNLPSRILQQFVNEQTKRGTEVIGDHPKGLCLFNREKGLHFVMIPKNASTSISISALTSERDTWVPCIANNNDDTRFIVVLRDPVDRFISSANMFLTTGKTLVGNLPVLTNDKIVTKDCHFQTQYKFISLLHQERIDFFWYNKDVVYQIEKYYGLKFNYSTLDLNISNRLITTIDNELIKKMYSEDYELINSVKFINV
jgi:hypothetical protein